MGSASEVDPRAVLVSAATQAARAADADVEYWTELASGQDSEEAEFSGWQDGARAALDAWVEAFCRGNVDALSDFAGQLREMGTTSIDKLAALKDDDPEHVTDGGECWCNPVIVIVTAAGDMLRGQ